MSEPVAFKRAKYNSHHSFAGQSSFNASATIHVGKTQPAQNLDKAAQCMINASLAQSTWSKYQSAYNTFKIFETSEQCIFPWPLDITVFRRFIVWCIAIRKLQPSTAEAYCSALKFSHHLRGLPVADWSKDAVIGLLLRGGPRSDVAAPAKSNTRRIVTFQLLLTIGHRISQTAWDQVSKQVVWTACCVAFFVSARMGELLASQEQRFDPTSDLLWSDVHFREEGSIILRLKSPKSGDKNGEFLDVFSFTGYKCCPVAAMTALWKKRGQFVHINTPVFSFENGKYLTPAGLNISRSHLLSDMCFPGKNSVSCHSFRAGIPTALSFFPDLVSSDDVKGWGRWSSDCYEKYSRLKHQQKQSIFGKIAAAIRSLADS